MFRKLVIGLPKKETDKIGIERKVWIVPALIHGTWLTDDARYALGDSTIKSRKLKSLEKISSTFCNGSQYEKKFNWRKIVQL